MKVRQNQKGFLELDPALQDKLKAESPRREITQQETVYNSDVVEVYKQAQKFAKAWHKNLKEVHLDYGKEWADPYDQHESVYLRMQVVGLETDEQWYSRLLEEHKNNAHREEWERKEWERLKSKFRES